MKSLHTVLLILTIITSLSSQDKKLWDLDELSDVNVMLFKHLTDTTHTKGTGTILTHLNRYYLLTAEHIAKVMDDESLVVFSVGNDIPHSIKLGDLKLNFNSEWLSHSIADIAIIELKLPKISVLKERFEKMAFPLALTYTGRDLMHTSTDLTFFGFPIIDAEGEHLSPLIFSAFRSSGLITTYRGDNKKKCTFFYLNQPSSQGCSGSGVYSSVNKPFFYGGDTTLMIGILHGTWSDSTGGKMALVTPAFYLDEFFK